jgi:hypothetical protein
MHSYTANTGKLFSHGTTPIPALPIRALLKQDIFSCGTGKVLGGDEEVIGLYFFLKLAFTSELIMIPDGEINP